MKKKILLALLGVVVVGMSIATFFVDRDAIIATIGVENAYAILFVVSATAGVSIFTAAGFYAFFVAFVNSSIDPLVASIVAGLGITIGDMIIFAFARMIRENSEAMRNSRLYQKTCRLIDRLPRWGVYIFTFLYASVVPIPNEMLMIILGVLRYKFWAVTAVMVAGNITLMYLIANGVISIT